MNGGGYIGIWRTGRGGSQFKGPKAGMCLVNSRNSKETNVAEVSGVEGKNWEMMGKRKQIQTM